jgi:hypothetical protein
MSYQSAQLTYEQKVSSLLKSYIDLKNYEPSFSFSIQPELNYDNSEKIFTSCIVNESKFWLEINFNRKLLFNAISLRSVDQNIFDP